ncbi:GNAT family N-acetyltransferase [Sphaerotilus sp.]|uniref:GNAT family N-acetyltransferase n=1 Tax=Sphaerotilus sp. TaxID=2093942 RepID=UPI002ACED981|nr:GNAT family N-acetyltransferase [Sphaerotilus sp.]MDZ7856465.1 GNAT family N-acetyltransferase [Sphaerotilus sp.]
MSAPSTPLDVPFGPSGTVVLRKMVLDEDAPLLHDWFSRDYARFWGLQGKTVEEIREKFAGIEASGTCDVVFGILASTGERLFMFESYDVGADTLGQHYPVQPGDRGFHFMIGPVEVHRPAMAFHTLQAVCTWIFRDASVSRIVCEPDLRNEKAMRRLVQAGYQGVKVVHLPYKSALLMQRSRGSFEASHDQPPPRQPERAPVAGLALQYHLLVSRIGRRIGLIERHW